MTTIKSHWTKVWVYFLCFVIVFAYILPLYVMGNVSVRVYTDESSWLIPTKEPILDNYIESFEDPNLLNSFKNTIIYALFEMLMLIPISALGGYGLSRSRGRISSAIRAMNVMVMMIPSTALLVGTYGLMVKLNLTNSLFGLALLGTGTGMTSCMFFYTTFCASIPFDLDDAAALDGAGVVTTFFAVIFPQLRAITTTRLIAVLTECWNNYLMPMYFLTKSRNYTILLLVRKLFQHAKRDFPSATAASVLMLVPIMVFYIILQKQIIGGQLDSAVKG